MVYEAYSQSNGSANWGNIVLESAHAGCFYTDMSTGEWATQFCCGSGDCGNVQPGGVTYMAGSSDPGQVSKRGNGPKPSDGKLVKPLGSATAPLKKGAGASSTTTSTTSRTAKLRRSGKARRDIANNEPVCSDTSLTKYYECTDDAWAPSGPSCSTTSSTQYQKAGQQEQVSSVLHCNTGTDCGTAHWESMTLTETLTNDHTVTSTSTNGVEVSANAGFSFGQQGGIGFDVGGSVTYKNEWSKAIADSSGFSNATAKTTTNTYTMNPAAGTVGFISFTGTFDCTWQETECDGVKFSTERCKPVKTNDGYAAGDYMWVTLG